MYEYNWLGLQRFTVAAKEPVPAGKANVRFEVIERTQPMMFSADETADVDVDGAIGAATKLQLAKAGADSAAKQAAARH
jgi:hypothetical protein